MRLVSAAALAFVLAACRSGDSSFEERTFDFHNLDSTQAMRVMQRQVLTACPSTTGSVSMMGGQVTVRGTPENINCIARVLAEHDRPPASLRLIFQVIRADGAGPRDSAIADIEQELRRLFRFQGYQLLAQGNTLVGDGAPFSLQLDGPQGNFNVSGRVPQLTVTGDSGNVQLMFRLTSPRTGLALESEISIGIGRTVVLGGHSQSGTGGLILSVRPEIVR